MDHATFRRQSYMQTHNPDHPTRTASHPSNSPPDSQSSSFNDSTASQNSTFRPALVGAHDLSQGILLPGAVTPETSLSNGSSQENAIKSQQDCDGVMTVQDEREFVGQDQLSHAAPSVARSPQATARREHTSAPKRMANGQVKSPTRSLPPNPAGSGVSAHSRNSSTTSRGSQIGELSNQLRTRLSYAMVKVQHGWQNHNISELEQITSQQASPVSAASDTRRPYEASWATGSPIDDSGVPTRSRRTTATASPQYLTHSPHRIIAPNKLTYPRRPTDSLSSPTSSVQASTYESFWREHSSSTASRPLQTNPLQAGTPTLAPPADIRPRNRPRSGSSSKKHPPTLHTRNLTTTQTQTHPSASSPSTPPSSKPPLKTRTPSQQAAVEKDAVETLLFMSSPVNSGYHHHPPYGCGPLPGTPLRGNNNSNNHHLTLSSSSRMTPTQTQPPPHSALSPFSSSSSSAIQTRRLPRQQQQQQQQPLSERDIDKMLDEIPDESSDDDDDVMLERRPAILHQVS